jgi:hypothetical protein
MLATLTTDLGLQRFGKCQALALNNQIEIEISHSALHDKISDESTDDNHALFSLLSNAQGCIDDNSQRD